MSDHEDIEDCDDCEACKGTGRISWFDHAEGAWRDAHCTDCDGKGVKFTVRKVETRVEAMSGNWITQRQIAELIVRAEAAEAEVERLRAKLVDFKACLEEHEQMPCDSTKRRVREAALDFALSAALAKP